MYNTKNAFVLDALNQNDPYLQHYGIMGMHWGVRRYQPYGQGYDPDHKGREVGLAARLAGGGTSYSNLYGRGAKKHSVLGANGGINVGPSNAAKRLRRGVTEGLERLNYANDRFGSALKTAGKQSRQGLVNYVSYLTPTSKAPDPMLQRLYQKDITDNKSLARAVARQFKKNAGYRVSQLKQTSMADVQKMLGNGASAFKDTMAKTKVNAKNFSRNAAMTAALLGGAFDPTSSASQIVEGRANRSVMPKDRRSATIGYKDMTRLDKLDAKKPRYMGLSEITSPAKYLSRFELSRMGDPTIAARLKRESDEYDKKRRAEESRYHNKKYGLKEFANKPISPDWKNRGKMQQEKGADTIKKLMSGKLPSYRNKEIEDTQREMERWMRSSNAMTAPARTLQSEREAVLRLLDDSRPLNIGYKVTSPTSPEAYSQLERRLLGL